MKTLSVNNVSPATLLVSVLLLCCGIHNTSSQSSPSHKNGFYRTEILYPNGHLEGSFTYRRSPVSFTSKYDLAPPPFFLPPPPLLRAASQNNNKLYSVPAPPRYLANFIPTFTSRTKPKPLFTPATIKQPAETLGQIQEYRKALEEERQELLKEEQERERQELVDVTTLAEFEGSTFLPDVTTELKSYVNVKQVDGDKKYEYNYAV